MSDKTILYVALLRGINVGGKNVIRMADLRDCFEAHGFEDVKTYIQSGNVLFRSRHKNPATLTVEIEGILSRTFDYQSRVLLRTHAQLRKVVASAPKGFGADPEAYRYDVLFLRSETSAAEAMKAVPVKDGVDEVFAGANELYFSRLISRASQSYLSRLVSLPVYQQMTIRNWSTTTKLLAMMGA